MFIILNNFALTI